MVVPPVYTSELLYQSTQLEPFGNAVAEEEEEVSNSHENTEACKRNANNNGNE